MKKTKSKFDAVELRSALMRIDDTSQESLTPPKIGTLYMPPGHVKALNLSASVVVGMRGAGKSYWTAALADEGFREFVARAARLPDLKQTKVAIGFALDPSSDSFPSAANIAESYSVDGDDSGVWLAVVLWHALSSLGENFPTKGDWAARIKWAKTHKDECRELLSRCDRELANQGRNLLVIFDALDRLAKDWEVIRTCIRSLLQFTLECRSRRAIKLKVFLRPDMEEDDGVWSFVDSSKLRASKVELTWRPADLFGLVINYLANDQDVGESVRNAIANRTGVEWSYQGGIYPLPRALALGEQPARAVIESFTGEWVGTSAKRGYVYTWMPTHLADARGRLSPRSFLLAFRAAANYTETHEPDFELALHYKGIQQGVAEASAIRVSEISEDYPWVVPLLEEARGLTVPCTIAELVNRWPRQSHLLDKIRAASGAKLPPRRFATDSVRRGRTDALVEDLVDLAVVYRTGDSRLNIPDIFRVGFGIKRMGGVRPPRDR